MGDRLDEWLARRGGRWIRRGDPDFPHLGGLADPPEALALRGSLAGAGAGSEPPAVAVIGSRRVDAAAIDLARRIGFALARAGFTVVSGGALGVDAAAHEGALAAGGATVAVLAGGVLRPHPPRNRALFARILAAGGGLCSETLDAPPFRWTFSRRNRLIAALARAVVVVRAGAGSGCRYTVEAAWKLGRSVFAVPPPDALAERAAYSRELVEGLFPRVRPVRDPDELLDALGVRRPGRGAAGLESVERRVLDALGERPASLGAVAAAASLSQAEAARLLARLCARGLVRPSGPGCFALGSGAGAG